MKAADGSLTKEIQGQNIITFKTSGIFVTERTGTPFRQFFFPSIGIINPSLTEFWVILGASEPTFFKNSTVQDYYHFLMVERYNRPKP
jgi:hypothetical protein